MKALTVVPTMGARTNRDIIDRIRSNSKLFVGMTLGTCIEQLRYFQKIGAVCVSEMFISILVDYEN